MTIIVGLTGGIASGKSTIINYIKKKRIPTHDSDFVVNKLYTNPTKKFLKYLKYAKIKYTISEKKIDKASIREEIFYNLKKKNLLEKYIHNEVKISRDIFLKKHKTKKTKLIFLDIPLLFEKKLVNICDYIILIYAPIQLRKKRTIKRKGMKKKILNKIINNQLTDTYKKKKADFIVNTSTSKTQSFNKISQIINLIKTDKYA